MLKNFDNRMLQALRSIQMNNLEDFDVVMDTLDKEVARIDAVTRYSQNEKVMGWNQGATQALSEFTTQARNARNTILQIKQTAELQAYEQKKRCKTEGDMMKDHKEAIQWKIYNLAFRVFGKTRFWPGLGFILWR